MRREVGKDIHQLLLGEYLRIVKDVPRLPMKEIAPLVRRSVKVELSEEYHELGIRSFGKGTFHKSPVMGVELGSKNIFSIEENDLLFNIVFAWEGAVAIAKPKDNGRVGSHRFLTCVPHEDIATPSFLCFHFLTEEGLQQILAASPGSAGRNRTLGIKALGDILVPVPSFKHQLNFEGLQKKMALVRGSHQENEAEFNALLPSILDKAFKGEL